MCNYATVFLLSGSETHQRIEEESSIQRGGCRNNAQEARPRGAEGGLQTLQCEIDSLQVSLDLWINPQAFNELQKEPWDWWSKNMTSV